MPVEVTDRRPFRPSVVHVRHYLPKIAVAVGRNHDLFPLPIFTEAEVRVPQRNAPRQTQTFKDATDWAELVVSSRLRLHGRSPAVARNILLGFVRWLDAKNYKYTSKPAGSLAEDKEMGHYNLGNEEYNLFACPGAPIGDCNTTASALALLMAMNGFPCDELSLALLGARGNSFVFRGTKERMAASHIVAPFEVGVLAPLVRVGHGKRLEQVPAAEADTPFSNHWVVQYRGELYDANYRAIYSDPSVLFAEASPPVTFAGGDAAPMNPDFLPGGKVIDMVRVPDTPEQSRCFFQLESPASLLSVACPSLSGWAHTGIFLVDVDALPGDDVVTMGGQPVAHKHAKLFGWCVPDNPDAVKRRLMEAVATYDNSVTGQIFRISTDASKDFCRKSRKWCDKTEIQDPRVRGNRIYSGVKWAGVVPWRNDDEARRAIRDAMGRQSIVGTTLRSKLWDAFGLPGYLRPA